MSAIKLTAEDLSLLREALSYDPETGKFYWRTKVSIKTVVGREAGSLWPSGYVAIRVFGQRYMAHRLAWAFIHGELPDCDVDHENRIKSDNRISNLRLATRSQNMANTELRRTNTSGVKGVYWCKRTNRWVARVMKNGKHIWVGAYQDLNIAAVKVREAHEQAFGSFSP